MGKEFIALLENTKYSRVIISSIITTSKTKTWMFLKPYFTLIRNPKSIQQLRARARTVGKIVRVQNDLGTKSENFRKSAKNLEETPCVFLVTILLKSLNNIPSIVFHFSIGLIYSNFLFRKPL